jgi:ABC-2 type transport system ATP-binding protein
VEIQDVGLRRPTLDDVFLSLTGHVAEYEEVEAGLEGAGVAEGGES